MQLPTKQSRATFSKVAMPYSLKLLDQEMSTFMNAGFRFVSEGSVARLREMDWVWPSMEVEFKAGERGVDAAVAVDPEAAAAAAKPQRKNVTPAPSETEGPDATQIRFSNKLQNEYIGFSNFAPTAFRAPAEQIAAPDGTQYPALGIAEDGSVDVGKQTWPTVEQYYQAMKFPADPAWQEAIRRASGPAKAKAMGTDAAHPLRGDWEQIKERVMKTALLAKFRQNPALLELLQGTGVRKLVEASTADLYWGAGSKGNGQNRLGALLEEVRGELKEIRPDQTVLAAVPEEKEEEQPVTLEGIAKQAQESVEELTGGLVKLGTIPEASEAAEQGTTEAKAPAVGQQGGVYLFINSAAGHSERRRRDRGSGRNLSWEGMAVSKVGSDEPQEGGGEQMTTESSNTTEVKVEKLDS
jgi:ribA/ribD-fused uncharacterized protein